MAYFEKAQARARRRESRWNLLLPVLFPAIWLPLILVSLSGIDRIHQLFYPDQTLFADPRGVAVLLACISVLFGSIPLSMLAANILIWLIPPARRGTSFLESQHTLLKFGAWWVSSAYAISTIGALFPW